MSYPEWHSRSHSVFIRYVINGLIATAVHFAVLTLLLEFAHLPSAGLANLIAAGFGITASFLGNRHFVFSATGGPVTHQAFRFGLLYASIAVLHGATLAIWTDWLDQDYRIGFVIATGLQFALSYLGNKRLVFSQ
jgi:putative flippase GtrA